MAPHAAMRKGVSSSRSVRECTAATAAVAANAPRDEYVRSRGAGRGGGLSSPPRHLRANNATANASCCRAVGGRRSSSSSVAASTSSASLVEANAPALISVSEMRGDAVTDLRASRCDGSLCDGSLMCSPVIDLRASPRSDGSPRSDESREVDLCTTNVRFVPMSPHT